MSESKPSGQKNLVKPSHAKTAKTSKLAKPVKPKKEHWSVEFFRRVDAWGDALRVNEKHSKA
jgi:hypothetical protein